ncbi:MAG: 50S ribosomal protein L29 [Zetaproteobacteria bacterium]|nr:MAG: 50S ribosomal protein L29 [Zetaproteobacteria bacterium]
MKCKDLRGKGRDELLGLLDDLAAEQMKLRFQKSVMQLNNTARLGQVRREIARIKTVLAEQRRGAGA